MAALHDDRLPMAPIPVHQAFRTLRAAFTLLPIAAGADKFFDRLVVWPHYLARPISEVLPWSPVAFMHAVGAAEILAGVVVAFYPIVGGWIVAGWLWAVIINLLLISYLLMRFILYGTRVLAYYFVHGVWRFF